MGKRDAADQVAAAAAPHGRLWVVACGTSDEINTYTNYTTQG